MATAYSVGGTGDIAAELLVDGARGGRAGQVKLGAPAR